MRCLQSDGTVFASRLILDGEALEISAPAHCPVAQVPTLLTSQHAAESKMTVEIVISDDHPSLCRGLSSILSDAGLVIVGTASNANETLVLCRTLRPDVLLLDVRLGPDDGLAVLGQLSSESPELKVAMISAHEDPTYVARSIARGAHDFLLKSDSGQSLVRAVERVASGDATMGRSRFNSMKTLLVTQPQRAIPPLTPRESQILACLAYGLSNRDIAAAVGVSKHTVALHVGKVLQKLQVHDRTAAAICAARNGRFEGW